MKLTVHINMAGGLAYQNKILGLGLHINGQTFADLDLPLSAEAFKQLKDAMRAKRLRCFGDVDALQAAAMEATGGVIPEELKQTADPRQEAADALNKLFEQDAEEKVEEFEALVADAPSEAEAEVAVESEEVPAEETVSKPTKKRK